MNLSAGDVLGERAVGLEVTTLGPDCVLAVSESLLWCGMMERGTSGDRTGICNMEKHGESVMPGP